MSTPSSEDAPTDDDVQSVSDPDEYGSLSVEDDPEGTVDPGELAGTADTDDEDVS
jgi:hypothetical protein